MTKLQVYKQRQFTDKYGIFDLTCEDLKTMVNGMNLLIEHVERHGKIVGIRDECMIEELKEITVRLSKRPN